MNLNQITIPVTNVARSIAFYRLLGLELIVEALPHYARFEAPVGQATFSLHQVSVMPVGEGAWVYFELDELDTCVVELSEKGITFDEMPTDKSWLWREARLRDPDGNIIILYHAGANRLNPPWRLRGGGK